MNFASILLLTFVMGLVVFDTIMLWTKNRRALLLEWLVFFTGAYFIAFPEQSTVLAHAFGIGRGVDFLIYPIVIWLTRESLLNRRRRIQDAENITRLTRALALAGVQAQEMHFTPLRDSLHTQASIPRT